MKPKSLAFRAARSCCLALAGTYDLINATGASLFDIDVTDFSLGTSIPGSGFAFIPTGNRFQVVANAIPEPSTALRRRASVS